MGFWESGSWRLWWDSISEMIRERASSMVAVMMVESPSLQLFLQSHFFFFLSLSLSIDLNFSLPSLKTPPINLGKSLGGLDVGSTQGWPNCMRLARLRAQTKR